MPVYLSKKNPHISQCKVALRSHDPNDTSALSVYINGNDDLTGCRSIQSHIRTVAYANKNNY